MTSAAADFITHSPNAAHGVSSQWSQSALSVVESSDQSGLPSTGAPPPPPGTPDQDGGDLSANARGKKPVWNVPSNGSMDAGSIMGDSWPALSESTRASPKSSSSDSLKALSDGSFFAATRPVIPSPPLKQNMTSPNHSSSPNHAAPIQQKQTSAATGVLPNGSSSIGSTPTMPPASAEVHEITMNKHGFLESSSKGIPNNNGNNQEHGGRGGGFTPHSYGANDQRSFSGNRRGNSGGSGFQNNNYGNRQDQESRGHEWNHRNFNNRDVQMQQVQPPRSMRPFLRPHTPVTTPFIAPPPPVRPFGAPMGYPDMPPQLYYLPPPAPYVAHPPPGMFFPAIDPQRTLLLKQIDFYFSPENLCKDVYLRRNMDDQGWVSISLIAGFNRVKQIAPNVQYVLDTMRFSTVVEIQGDRIRKRNDWMNWVLAPASNHYSNSSAPQSSSTPSIDTLASHLQTVGLEGATNKSSTGGNVIPLARSASGNFNNQHLVGGNFNGDTYGQDPDQAKHARGHSEK